MTDFHCSMKESDPCPTKIVIRYSDVDEEADEVAALRRIYEMKGTIKISDLVLFERKVSGVYTIASMNIENDGTTNFQLLPAEDA